jgi:hypothetical protein
MIFSQNTQVIYKDMQGVVSFVCDKYVVIEMQTKPQFNPPRLLVYRETYKQIEILKASTR